MAHFSGKLSHKGGSSVAVEGEYTAHGHGGWDGRMQAKAGKPIDLGEYTLTLDDGKQGKLVVTQSQSSSSGPSEASFDGKGPAPK